MILQLGNTINLGYYLAYTQLWNHPVFLAIKRCGCALAHSYCSFNSSAAISFLVSKDWQRAIMPSTTQLWKKSAAQLCLLKMPELYRRSDGAFGAFGQQICSAGSNPSYTDTETEEHLRKVWSSCAVDVRSFNLFFKNAGGNNRLRVQTSSSFQQNFLGKSSWKVAQRPVNTAYKSRTLGFQVTDAMRGLDTLLAW